MALIFGSRSNDAVFRQASAAGEGDFFIGQRGADIFIDAFGGANLISLQGAGDLVLSSDAMPTLSGVSNGQGFNDVVTISNDSNSVNSGNGDNFVFLGGGNPDVTAQIGAPGADAFADAVDARFGLNATTAPGAYNGLGFDELLQMLREVDLATDASGAPLFSSGNDRVTTGRGNDVILTGNGDDLITTIGGDNQIEAGDGDNVISAGGGDDLLIAGAGDDTILGGEGANSIFAGDGNNLITGGNDFDSVSVGVGADVITLGQGGDEPVNVNGFLAQNLVSDAGGADTITGGSDNDYVISDGVAQVPGLEFLAGDDELILLGGDNTVFDFGGNNLVRTEAGSDALFMFGVGDDTLESGGGSDTILAGGGRDVIASGGGVDEVDLDDFGAPATDIVQLVADDIAGVELISNFDPSSPDQGGDILDLSGLLAETGFDFMPVTAPVMAVDLDLDGQVDGGFDANGDGLLNDPGVIVFLGPVVDGFLQPAAVAAFIDTQGGFDAGDLVDNIAVDPVLGMMA